MRVTTTVTVTGLFASRYVYTWPTKESVSSRAEGLNENPRNTHGSGEAAGRGRSADSYRQYETTANASGHSDRGTSSRDS